MKRKTIIVLALFGCLVLFALFAGRLLVANAPDRSDVIVVLAGDSMDIRFARGMDLLRQGYARQLFLDAAADTHFFGKTPAEYASTYLTAGAHSPSFAKSCRSITGRWLRPLILMSSGRTGGSIASGPR
jgi:hypothetical protein